MDALLAVLPGGSTALAMSGALALLAMGMGRSLLEAPSTHEPREVPMT